VELDIKHYDRLATLYDLHLLLSAVIVTLVARIFEYVQILVLTSRYYSG